MIEFNSLLNREKFTIHGMLNKAGEDAGPLVALSNRMRLDLTGQTKKPESIIVRSHNMHSCVRMCARLVRAYQEDGSLIVRKNSFRWGDIWDGETGAFSRTYNPENWVVIYYDGKIIFQAGEHHPFLDVIERCEIDNDGLYDESVALAENKFADAGKTVNIDYDSNIALNVKFEEEEARCGIILRGSTRSTTFNFSVLKEGQEYIEIPYCLNICAAFLEGIQLAYKVAHSDEKLTEIKQQHRSADEEPPEEVKYEEKYNREAKMRLAALSVEIDNFDNNYTTHYRPEKPDIIRISGQGDT